MTLDELRRRQWAALAWGLAAILPANRFYRERFERAGLDAAALGLPDDFHALPPTTKDDLLADQEAHPPYGSNLSRPVREYTRLHQTSGTSGRRLRWLDTPRSWDWVVECWDHIYAAAGVTDRDRFFFPFSFGPFLGFWAALEGASRRDRFVLAGGGMTTVARLHLLLENDVTFVLCTPTYALRLAEVAEQEGIDLAAGGVRGLILAGEPGASIPQVRSRLETAWGARVFDHSGMTEIGPLCLEYVEHPRQLFALESRAIVEVVEPGTETPTPEGGIGELLVTNLGRWDCPLLRYRTGDLVRWRRQLQPGGMPFIHFEGGILGRTDDMLLIRGNNVYPSAIEALLREFEQVCEFHVEAKQAASSVELEIVIEPFPSHADDSDLASRITAAVQDRFFFRPKVSLVRPGSLPRFEMKANRFRKIAE